jgi:7-cyano-7-deazaguanine tRNA-ribosyltransferase
LQIVAGLNLNKRPRVWNLESPYYLPQLQAVMVSYADFDRSPVLRQRVMEQGLRAYLNLPDSTQIYLDNGAFAFLRREREVPRDEYEEFVECAAPDWYAIPQDYIPAPRMSDEEQMECLQRTMQVNQAYRHNGYVPVIHISRHLDKYLHLLQADEQLLQNKDAVALGGIVPNLLRMPRAMRPENVLNNVRQVRAALDDKQLHVFGVGGTATLHLAALLGVDSVDSAGWRNRAARGIIQLPGRGERIIANLGSWRGRELDEEEWAMLENCPCPACEQFGVEGLQINGMDGFCNRATHNLWTLLDEARQIDEHLVAGTYTDWYMAHVQNSTYLPFIQQAVTWLNEE